MWPFNKNKFEKIKRSDVVDSIINIERRQQEEIDNVGEREKEIAKLLQQGKACKSRDMQLALAKRINLLKKENSNSAQRIQYLNANLQALNQLKTAIDDKDFISNNSDIPINKLLTDTAALQKFLAGVTNKKMKGESKLSAALDTFDNVDDGYEANERIYGVSEQDEQLLSMFEMENSEEDASVFGAPEYEKNTQSIEKDSL
ncbi:MAG: hypothetical protein ACI4MI_02900 [Christensenellales bacterium]